MSAGALWVRLLGGAAARAVRAPRATVAIALVVVAVGALLAGTQLELRSSNLDLVDAQLPEVARFRAFAAEFGTPNLLVVVLEGGDAVALSSAADRVAGAAAPVAGVRTVWARLPFRDEILVPLGVDPYFRSRDGRQVYLFVQPADAESAATTIGPFVEGVRRAIGELALERDAIRVGYTGLPQYALDDRDTIQRDIARLSGFSFLAVFALFAWSFRGLREPLLAMAVLAAAAVATAGCAALVPGHLTLVSAFFFSILFGLGIDFGVHLVGRAEEELAAGAPPAQALVTAVRELAPALGTGAATTAASFFLLLVSGLKGFAELGGLAGLGVVITLVGMVTLLPALLVLFPGRQRPARARRTRPLVAAARPVVAIPLLALLSVAAVVAVAAPPRFNGDYLDLQPAGSEAVRLEREMVARSDGAAQFAAFVTPDADAARRLVERLRVEPTVGAVRSAADYEALLTLGAELPEEWARFQKLYVGRDGRQAVYAFPKGDVWEPGFQGRFATAMRTLDPEVTGMPFLGRFLVERSRRALAITGVAAALMLLALVAADLTNPWRAALALFPTFGAAAAMVAAMKLLGLDFNPLNVLALPIVLGVAEDGGVHLVHRFVVEGGDLARTLAGTGRELFVCGATTLVGFGALVFADHRGLASFAATLALGVGSSLVLTLLALPYLLRALSPRLLSPGRNRPARRAAGWIALALAPAWAGAAHAASAAEERAALCWQARARGFAESGNVDPGPARCALDELAAARRAEPARLDLAFREIEALWFGAHFAPGNRDEARARLDRAVEVADAALEEVAMRAGKSPGGLSYDERAARWRGVPEAGEAAFWAAVAWGEWSQAHGAWAAVARGAVGRLRDAAELAARLAPAEHAGGGLRLLGRLHAVAPRVPFVSGWVDRERGLQLLREAHALAPRDPRNQLFLAEALLELRPAERTAALALLADLAARVPDPMELVEQSETIAAARARLAAEGGS